MRARVGFGVLFSIRCSSAMESPLESRASTFVAQDSNRVRWKAIGLKTDLAPEIGGVILEWQAKACIGNFLSESVFSGVVPWIWGLLGREQVMIQLFLQDMVIYIHIYRYTYIYI